LLTIHRPSPEESLHQFRHYHQNALSVRTYPIKQKLLTMQGQASYISPPQSSNNQPPELPRKEKKKRTPSINPLCSYNDILQTTQGKSERKKKNMYDERILLHYSMIKPSASASPPLL